MKRRLVVRKLRKDSWMKDEGMKVYRVEGCCRDFRVEGFGHFLRHPDIHFRELKFSRSTFAPIGTEAWKLKSEALPGRQRSGWMNSIRINVRSQSREAVENEDVLRYRCANMSPTDSRWFKDRGLEPVMNCYDQWRAVQICGEFFLHQTLPWSCYVSISGPRPGIWWAEGGKQTS